MKNTSADRLPFLLLGLGAVGALGLLLGIHRAAAIFIGPPQPFV